MPCAVHETTAVTATASTATTQHPDPSHDAILEQLSASIAEINQPISAVVMNAEAALQLLGAQPTDTAAIRQLLACIVKDGLLTGDLVSRTRALTDRRRPDERLRAGE